MVKEIEGRNKKGSGVPLLTAMHRALARAREGDVRMFSDVVDFIRYKDIASTYQQQAEYWEKHTGLLAEAYEELCYQADCEEPYW